MTYPDIHVLVSCYVWTWIHNHKYQKTLVDLQIRKRTAMHAWSAHAKRFCWSSRIKTIRSKTITYPNLTLHREVLLNWRQVVFKQIISKLYDTFFLQIIFLLCWAALQTIRLKHYPIWKKRLISQVCVWTQHYATTLWQFKQASMCNVVFGHKLH